TRGGCLDDAPGERVSTAFRRSPSQRPRVAPDQRCAERAVVSTAFRRSPSQRPGYYAGLSQEGVKAVSTAFRRSPSQRPQYSAVTQSKSAPVSTAFRRSPSQRLQGKMREIAVLFKGLHCLSAFTVAATAPDPGLALPLLYH